MKPLTIGATHSIGDEPEHDLQQLQDLQLKTAQIFPPASLEAAPLMAALPHHDVEISAVIAHFAGESYADVAAVQNTVGLVPLATREARIEQFLRIAHFAQQIGVAQVQTHIGFIPEDASDPLYDEIVQETRGICDKLAENAQIFALETGQETAATLARFIKNVERDNLRVNFDPANMMMYGNDQPKDALQVLAPWIVSVHCKDGCWPTEEGKLGHEEPLGKGEVDFEPWLRALLDGGYRGPLVIEREISGEAQKRDIIHARELIENVVRDYQ